MTRKKVDPQTQEERRAYERGYNAGVRRARRNHEMERDEAIFCAALNGLLTSTRVWNDGAGKEYRNTTDYVRLAWEFVKAARNELPRISP